jgi:hypothetical protein
MSRSGYSDDDYDWGTIMWRGAVASAIRGKRGQAFLLELLASLDALLEKRLIANELEKDGEVCAIGALGKRRGVDMAAIDPDDREQVARVFGIAPALASEVVYMNDEAFCNGSPERRFEIMRAWVLENIQPVEEVAEGRPAGPSVPESIPED